MIFIFTVRENVEKISFTVSEKVENFHFPYRVKKSVNYREKSIIINNTSVGAEVARQKVF